MRPQRSYKAQQLFSSRGRLGYKEAQKAQESDRFSVSLFVLFCGLKTCESNETERLFTYRTGDHHHRAFDHDDGRIAARESFSEAAKGATAPRVVAPDAHGNRRVSSRLDGH